MSGTPELTPLDVIIGMNAKRLRTAKQIGQETMADKLGCSVGMISLLEKGQRVWKTRWIYGYAQALEVDAAELMQNGVLSDMDDKTAELIKSLEDTLRKLKSPAPAKPKSKN